MKNVTIIFGNIFFRFMKLHTGLSHYGGRHSGGGGGIAEAPRSITFIDLCKILDDLCKKIGAEITLYPKKITFSIFALRTLQGRERLFLWILIVLRGG
jgi:hypothetical protein